MYPGGVQCEAGCAAHDGAHDGALEANACCGGGGMLEKRCRQRTVKADAEVAGERVTEAAAAVDDKRKATLPDGYN
jgi:hypothetical protein